MGYGRNGKVGESHFHTNHLYGTFTAAKERIVWVQWAKSASDCITLSVVNGKSATRKCAVHSSVDKSSDAVPPLKKKEASRPPKKRKN